MKEKIKAGFKNTVEFLLNPRLLVCLGIAWLVTNGWSYILFTVGTVYEITWMVTVSGAYLTFLWLPISPEKIVTVALAIALLRIFFPNDQRTLSKLRSLHEKISEKIKNRRG